MRTKTRIGEQNARLARQFARNIVELRRRGDYSDLQGQARRDFAAAVFFWGEGETDAEAKRYALPDGTATRDVETAVTAWATA